MDNFDRSSLTDKVYALLKQRIIAQSLVPGQKVDIDRLAADLGISRTPVKDALNRLAADGLVNVLARRGTFIARFDLNDLLDLLDVRLALEAFAARQGAERATAEQLREMEAVLQHLERDFREDRQVQADYDGFQALDRRLHLLVIASAANPKLSDFCDNLHTDIQMARAYYTRGDLETARVHAEHRAIYEAFVRKDGEAAAQAVESHLGRVRHSLCSGVVVPAQTQDYTSIP